MAAADGRKLGVILIVDDEPLVRALVRECLPGWSVVEAPDGEAGLARAREVRPDLVITDWQMARMTGPQLVRALRQDPSLNQVPVVMLTAHTGREHRAESYESGADHFLPKDFAPAELQAIVERAVQRQKRLEFAAPLMLALGDRVSSGDGAEVGKAVSQLGDFQQQMLPAGERRMADLTVGACLVPSVIASGDFYDYLSWDEGRELGFVLGDVSGHGLAAAYFMVMVRTALRVLCRQHCRLSEAVEALNQILLDETPVGWFVTLFYGVANPRTAELRYVSAGHCPAVLGNVRGGWRLLEPTGPALGLFPGRAYPETVIRLEEGAQLACATDGVLDAVRTQDLEARYAWVRNVMAEHAGGSALEMAQALVRGAEADAVGDHRDDLAALVLRRA